MVWMNVSAKELNKEQNLPFKFLVVTPLSSPKLRERHSEWAIGKIVPFKFGSRSAGGYSSTFIDLCLI